jgi:hypothetical protein
VVLFSVLPSHSLWFSSCFHLILCDSLPTSISNSLWFSSYFHLFLCGSLLPTSISLSVVLFLVPSHSLSFFPFLHPILCGFLPSSISFSLVIFLLPSLSLWFSSYFHLILCVLFLLLFHSLWFSSCFHLILCGSLPTSISFSVVLSLLPSHSLWISSFFFLILCGSLPTISNSVVLFLVQACQSTLYIGWSGIVSSPSYVA